MRESNLACGLEHPLEHDFEVELLEHGSRDSQNCACCLLHAGSVLIGTYRGSYGSARVDDRRASGGIEGRLVAGRLVEQAVLARVGHEL